MMGWLKDILPKSPSIDIIFSPEVVAEKLEEAFPDAGRAIAAFEQARSIIGKFSEATEMLLSKEAAKLLGIKGNMLTFDPRPLNNWLRCPILSQEELERLQERTRSDPTQAVVVKDVLLEKLETIEKNALKAADALAIQMQYPAQIRQREALEAASAVTEAEKILQGSEKTSKTECGNADTHPLTELMEALTQAVRFAVNARAALESPGAGVNRVPARER